MAVCELHGIFQFSDDLFEDILDKAKIENVAKPIQYEAKTIYPMVKIIFSYIRMFND